MPRKRFDHSAPEFQCSTGTVSVESGISASQEYFGISRGGSELREMMRDLLTLNSDSGKGVGVIRNQNERVRLFRAVNHDPVIPFYVGFGEPGVAACLLPRIYEYALMRPFRYYYGG